MKHSLNVNRTDTTYFQNDLNIGKMTVPAAGAGVLGPRKPLYRCIPEIHVTRLSASSSLRPKLGLLLLFVVLLWLGKPIDFLCFLTCHE